jgi:hypothetical protein
MASMLVINLNQPSQNAEMGIDMIDFHHTVTNPA